MPQGFDTVCVRACSIAKALTSSSTETTFRWNVKQRLEPLKHQSRLRELVGLGGADAGVAVATDDDERLKK
jgi:hypothetical protein